MFYLSLPILYFLNQKHIKKNKIKTLGRLLNNRRKKKHDKSVYAGILSFAE